MESPPPDTMVEEREEEMVSPTGGNPNLRKAYFLKHMSPSSIDEDEPPPFELHRRCLASLPSHFEPTKWPLKVEFYGWRTCQESWKLWVDQMASLHHSTWKKAGIYEAIITSTYTIRKQTDLAYGLAEKWCWETNTFIFPWGEATITLEDVMVLGGYSVLGDSVLRPLDIEEKVIEEKLNEGTKEIYETGAKLVATYAWLKKFMDSGSAVEHEAFLACWLSRYVFPGSSQGIYRPVFSIAIHLARGTRIALAPAVLASIYKDLGLLKTAINVTSSKMKIGSSGGVLGQILKSPFNLVQVWAWERFSDLSPKWSNLLNYGEPRMARWDKVNCPKVENLRRVLDSAGENFLWRPYALDVIENWHLPKYYPEKEMSVLVGPDLDDDLLSFVRCVRVSDLGMKLPSTLRGALSGYDTIEHYLPHRVAMQFGYDQDLPCSVTRANQNIDETWKHYNKEIKNVKLYLPSRLSKADVTTKYLKWWKQSVSGLQDSSDEAAVPRKKRRKSVSSLLSKADHPSVPPGFPPKCKRAEAEDLMDEDKLTLSDFVKYKKKHRNCGTSQGSDSEKLSSQVQNSASPIAEEVSFKSIVGNDCASILSFFEKRCLENKARAKRLESMIDELK